MFAIEILSADGWVFATTEADWSVVQTFPDADSARAWAVAHNLDDVSSWRVARYEDGVPPCYLDAYEWAQVMLDNSEDLFITHALREAGAAAGIPWGDKMGAFVAWGHKRMGV